LTHLDTEVILVESLQKGDLTALPELMQLYQKPALQWATQIVRDTYLAEDVVQEAFAQLQRKIPSLKDPSRFRPWFRQMVHRLALNQIRGSHNRIIIHEDIAQVQQNIEAVYKTISNDPLEELLQQSSIKELLDHSMSISSEQARSVMHAHAIENYNPDEIAALFQTSKSNIYNIISRTRVKANEERFRYETAHYIMERKRLGLKKHNMLEPPSFSSPYSLMSIAIKEVLRYAGSQERSLTDIMGISGDAFRLNVAKGCHWRGISTFDWSYAAFQTMERLGWQVSCFGRPGRSTLTPEQQVEVLRIIQASIDAGLPAIIWNLTINQFGLVYGYDDEAQTITYRGFRQNTQQYAYNQLGRNNEEPALFRYSINIVNY
jgi:RNA polymerase sigma factor (sigma-70 family)